MLIPLKPILKKYDIFATGIIQVGVNKAQEHEYLLDCGITKFLYVEPCKLAYQYLINRFSGSEDVQIFQFAAGSDYGKGSMFTETANQGQSNSLLRPKDHLVQHPDIVFNGTEEVRIMPLDTLFLINEGCNILMMDVQGFELEVLKGATKILSEVDLVYTEVNRGEVYEGCAQVEQIDQFLWEYGFEKKSEYLVPNGTWGDAIYISTKLLSNVQ